MDMYKNSKSSPLGQSLTPAPATTTTIRNPMHGIHLRHPRDMPLQFLPVINLLFALLMLLQTTPNPSTEVPHRAEPHPVPPRHRMLLVLPQVSRCARRPVEELRAVENAVGGAVAEGDRAAVEVGIVDGGGAGLSPRRWLRAWSLVGFATGPCACGEGWPVHHGSGLWHAEGVLDDVVVLLGVRRGRVHRGFFRPAVFGGGGLGKVVADPSRAPEWMQSVFRHSAGGVFAIVRCGC